MSETNGKTPAQQPQTEWAITRDQYDAVLLDLDGVITDTASIHAACWKQMFDEYLQKRATQRGEAFRPFDPATDYRLHVDGKPRFDGVRDFLTSRGIQLTEGVEQVDQRAAKPIQRPSQHYVEPPARCILQHSV